MINNKYLSISGGLLFLALLGGCSSHTVKQAESKNVAPPMVVKPQANTANPSATNDIVIKQRQAAARQAQAFANAEKAAQLRKRKRMHQHRQIANRTARPVARHQARVAQRPAAQRPRHAVNTGQPNIRRASFTGDFASNPKAQRFIDKMVSRYGFDRAYMNGVMSNAQATPWLQKMAARDERPLKRKRKSKPSWSKYRGHFLTSKHINEGVAFYKRNRQALERAERQFGVPKEYILGILGVETIFGGNIGKNRAIDALATMAFNNNRRGKYFESELESYLLMTRSSHINPLVPKSSYAGAIGLSQFMPSNVKRYGVDFDRDGSINLWKPNDAIASVARYFKGHGWRSGEMVAVPARNKGKGYRYFKTGYKHKYSPSRLANKGVTASFSHNMKGSLRLIKLNTYAGDELWVGGKNFYVITRYNHSTHYAMAVHQLAQAIKKRIEPGYSPYRGVPKQFAPKEKRPISAEEAMELLSASNDRKDAPTELNELKLANKSS